MPRIGLHLTDRCQLDCDHCLRDPGREPVDLPLEIIDSVLRDAASAYGIRRVSMTGGEPTLHPRFAEILDLVVKHGMRWDIVSNGRRFDRVADMLDAVPARRDACQVIAFSVDGATDATHDGIRSTGQRREVLSAISIAVAIGIPFATTTTLHARNIAEIEAIAIEASGLGASSVRFGMMQPTGTQLDEAMRLRTDQWEAAHLLIQQLQARGLPVSAAEGWPSAAPMGLCAPLRGETLHVDHHGRLTLCCQHSGLPASGEDGTIAGDASKGLTGPHRRLLQIQHDTIAARLASADGAPSDPTGPWANFRCNTCLRHFGRPHWTEGGVGGAVAQRERWRDASDRRGRRKRNLPVTG